MTSEHELTLQTDRMQAKIEDGIGWMVFNNPARHNALSLEMWEGIGDILEHFASNDNVRVIVMRGAGGQSFVSGADISKFDKSRANAEQRPAYGVIAGRATQWLAKIEKPLIGLIEGYCIGGGLATALSADVRFATPDSRFGIPQRSWGWVTNTKVWPNSPAWSAQVVRETSCFRPGLCARQRSLRIMGLDQLESRAGRHRTCPHR